MSIEDAVCFVDAGLVDEDDDFSQAALSNGQDVVGDFRIEDAFDAAVAQDGLDDVGFFVAIADADGDDDAFAEGELLGHQLIGVHVYRLLRWDEFCAEFRRFRRV